MDFIKNSLKEYVEQRVPPGGFLHAVLCNDLTKAVTKADERNIRQLRDIVLYVYNDLPSSCWGSEAIVKEWLEGPTIDEEEEDEEIGPCPVHGYAWCTCGNEGIHND